MRVKKRALVRKRRFFVSNLFINEIIHLTYIFYTIRLSEASLWFYFGEPKNFLNHNPAVSVNFNKLTLSLLLKNERFYLFTFIYGIFHIFIKNLGTFKWQKFT